MSLELEFEKAKRTGFLPAFLVGGIVAAAVPILNIAVRSEIFVSQQGSPIHILLNENWQMMEMLNVLLVIVGACLLYHTEYTDNALQKMKTLPFRESSIFLGKTILMSIMIAVVLTIEAVSIAFCSFYWFKIRTDYLPELSKNFGYSFLLSLPCIVLSLLISSACKNMWTSLGIGVVCIFTATILPSDNFVLSLFPFAIPFQLFAGTDMTQAAHYIRAAAIELLVIGLAELIFIKIRRSFE